MSNSTSTSTNLNVHYYNNEKYDKLNSAINEYFKLRQIYGKQINEKPKFIKDKIYNDKVSYVNTISDWNDEEKNNFIHTYTKPDSNNTLQVTDLENEVSLRKEIRNNIYKEACLSTMNIINKYFNIQTKDTTDNDYKNVYDKYKFCLVPLYISPNKESSDRLLNAYKKLTKTIWLSISLIKHNDFSFQIKELIQMMMILKIMIVLLIFIIYVI